MKKLIFVFVALVAMSFVSCGNGAKSATAADSDSVAVDSIDTVAVDSDSIATL